MLHPPHLFKCYIFPWMRIRKDLIWQEFIKPLWSSQQELEDNIFRLRLRLRRNEKEVGIYICFAETVEGLNDLLRELNKKNWY